MRALPDDPAYRRDVLSVYAVVAILNVGAWTWALVAFAGQPVMIGIGVVVYGLGLRHAVDADHIAAIDNVTRKLLQRGKRSASIGLWFALGHSAVIVLATAAVVSAAGTLNHLESFREYGGIASAGVSGIFLLLVAAMNVCIFLAIVRTMRRARSGQPIEEAELNVLFSGNGLLSRLFRPLFRCVSKPWHMALLGFVFGLSFDTATEVALFGISATQAADGMEVETALVFPMLFAAGMALLDTTDGVLMVGAYHWAVADPLRKLYYNMTITLMSITVALFVGSVQLAALAVRLFGWTGSTAHRFSSLNENLNYLGMAIVAAFLLAWAISASIFRFIHRPTASAEMIR